MALAKKGDVAQARHDEFLADLAVERKADEVVDAKLAEERRIAAASAPASRASSASILPSSQAKKSASTMAPPSRKPRRSMAACGYPTRSSVRAASAS